MNVYIPWVRPFFGESPETYFAHHVALHHPGNNFEDDVSTTLRFVQRSDIRLQESDDLCLALPHFSRGEPVGGAKRPTPDRTTGNRFRQALPKMLGPAEEPR
jgi:hypothetical protein